MSRLKAAFVSGTITNNPLAIGGTTLTSAELSTFPTIASPDIGVIVLDPRGTAGAPEVVWVTAHSAAATTCTIARAKEGSTARQHASGVAWVHGPTIMDMNQSKGTDIASASTLTLPDSDQDYFHITGTTGVTAISSRAAGKRVTLEFDGIVTLTHNATSLILANGTDFTTRAGTVLEFVSEDSGNWRQVLSNVNYRSAVGTSVTLTTINTYYDSPSASISLTPGTWLIMASGFIQVSANHDNLQLEVRDGSNNTVSSALNVISPYVQGTISIEVIVSPTSTTTYKVSGKNLTNNGGSLSAANIIAIKLL